MSRLISYHITLFSDNHGRIALRLYHGYTLIELVLVIVIIGVIGIVVNPFSSQISMTVDAEARHVLSDIRYAQALSMATGQRYRWVQTSSNTYQIISAAGSAMAFANGSSVMTLSSGTSFSGISNLPGNLINFDTAGIPYVDTGTPGTPLTSTATITISNGSYSRSITILGTSGYGALA